MKQTKKIDSLRAKVAQPKIFFLEITGIEKKDAYIQKWGWCDLMDLYGCLRDMLPEIKTPKEIFERYGLLCEQKNGEPLFTWVSLFDYAIDSDTYRVPGLADRIYVPAGWTKRILTLAKDKVVQVTSSPFVWHEEKRFFRRSMFQQISTPFLGPFMSHQLIAHNEQGIFGVIHLPHTFATTTKEARVMLMID